MISSLLRASQLSRTPDMRVATVVWGLAIKTSPPDHRPRDGRLEVQQREAASRNEVTGLRLGLELLGAGEGNRTLVVSLGSSCSTIELHPPRAHSYSLRAHVSSGRLPAVSWHVRARPANPSPSSKSHRP